MVAPVKANLRQMMFCREYMKLGNKTKAWQIVHGTKSRECAQAASSHCMSKPHVKRYLQELEERVMKKSDISIDKVLTDCQVALDMAKGQGKAGDMIAATMAQAKLVGLLRDRVETGGVGDFGDTNSIADVLEMVSREAGPEAAMTLAAMFGLKVPDSNVTENMKEAALFIADPPSDAVN
jgi:Terminase small subunit